MRVLRYTALAVLTIALGLTGSAIAKTHQSDSPRTLARHLLQTTNRTGGLNMLVYAPTPRLNGRYVLPTEMDPHASWSIDGCRGRVCVATVQAWSRDGRVAMSSPVRIRVRGRRAEFTHVGMGHVECRILYPDPKFRAKLRTCR